MGEGEKKHKEAPDREKIKEQLALLRPRAFRAATLAFHIASRGVEDLRADKRTADKLERAGALIVWLELLAFILYLFDRVATLRLKDSRHVYMELLMSFILSAFPDEAEKHGRKGLRSELGWEDDVRNTVSTRLLQYFSLEQEVEGGAGSVESLPPEGLFWEFGGVIAHQMGAPEDKAVTELVSLRARTSLAEVIKEVGSTPVEPAT